MTMISSAIATRIRCAAMRRCLVAVCLLLAVSSGALGQEPEDAQSASIPAPVPLNLVTLRNQLAWSLQALLAPELLETGVPLYAYSLDEAIEVLENPEVTDVKIESWYVGAAIREGEQWEAYPIPIPEQGKTLAQISESLQELSPDAGGDGAGGNSTQGGSGEAGRYVVSNLPLAGLEIKKKLWISREKWPNDLSANPS